MDPALQEEIRPELDPNEAIEAIVRLKDKASVPAGLHVISQFDEIITCRVRRGDVESIYHDPRIVSFKAARLLTRGGLDDEYTDKEERPEEQVEIDLSEINLLVADTGPATGKGVVIGIIDWGGDFAHADFINPDGTSRFLALWDQTTPANARSPVPFGYGTVYDRAEMSAALKTDQPYQTLGYHPGKGGPKGGAHGTHVLGIAAGNGHSGIRGIAPEADIIFVHLGSGDIKPFMNLGDSVKFLEAIDFIRITAGTQPLVINASVGRHGGSHDGRSLGEMAMDIFLENQLNTAICQSTGNYYQSDTHASGSVFPGRTQTMVFTTDKADVTPNELEIWYPARDIFLIELEHTGSALKAQCDLDNNVDLTYQGQVVGRLYHRSKEPNNGLNHVNLFLYPTAPFGEWQITLYGHRVVDGRFHAWIERDGGCPTCQSKFRKDFADRLTTTGTICNGYNTIVVGALDTHKNSIGHFSSSGPTVDGRTKPNLLAPGVNIWAAKSSALAEDRGGQKLIRMSGTSMATPHVTGTVALMLGTVASEMDIHTLRRLLLKSASPLPAEAPDKFRTGSGVLNIKGALAAMEEYNTQHKPTPAKEEYTPASQFAVPEPSILLPDLPRLELAGDFTESLPAPDGLAGNDLPAENELTAESELAACDGYGEEYGNSANIPIGFLS